MNVAGAAAIVCQQKTGQGRTVEGHASDTVLNSQAVQASFKADNSCSRPQAFPEGSAYGATATITSHWE